MQKANRFNNQLVSPTGYVITDLGAEDDSQNKNFAIVAKCGHVGDGYFVPILFSTCAKDKESAKEIIRNYPRVKNHVHDCILATKEISYIEDIFIKTINRFDPYLTFSAKKSEMDARKMVASSFIESLSSGRREKKWADRRFNVKLAKDFPPYLTLQRYFSPSLVGEEYVYPKNVDMDLLLRDFFISRTRYLGLQRGNAQILICYYKVFGPDNQFGVQLDDEKVTYVGENGAKHEILLDKRARATLAIEGSSRLLDAIRAKTPRAENELPQVEGKAKSGIERFRERIQKTKILQNDGEGK